MAAADRGIKALKKLLEAQGFDVQKTRRGGHFKVYQDGHLITALASTPSDWRGRRNDIAKLRRRGAEIPH